MYAKLTSQELLDNLDNQCGDYADGERVVSIVQDIFDGSDVEKVKWYCSDIHGIQHDLEEHLPTLKWLVVYDSSTLPICDCYEYNKVSVARDREYNVLSVNINGTGYQSSPTLFIWFERVVYG